MVREEPSQKLTDLLDRLALATPTQVRQMASRVRRLARGLPPIDSVWVDALAQARLITPYQASQINAGQGSQLAVGPYVLAESLPTDGLGAWYRARCAQTGQSVRLLTVPVEPRQRAEIEQQLESLVVVSRQLPQETLLPASEAGLDDARAWIVCADSPGQSAAQFMVQNGRLPGEVVLEIARTMAVALAACQQAGIVHGNLAAQQLLLTDAGQIHLPLPGVRGIVRPQEGYVLADLAPEAYDYLAPERITEGGPPTVASDLYACGCLWWHLLTGRPPLTGGDALAKLRSAHEGRIGDVRRLAPHTPEVLAQAIDHCCTKSPQQRCGSWDQLIEMLGPCSSHAQRMVARCMTAQHSGPLSAGVWRSAELHRRGKSPAPKQRARPARRLAAAAIGCVAMLAALTWPLWRQVPPLSIDAPADNPPANTVTSNLAAGTAGLGERPEVDLPSPTDSVPDLVLRSGEPVLLDSLQLEPGQTVRGASGERPQIVISRQSLVIDEEDVRFVGIDFVCISSTGAGPVAANPHAMIRLHARQAEFRGCSFHAPRGGSPGTVAIAWTSGEDAEQDEEPFPTGRLRMTDSALRNVTAAVDCHGRGAVVLDFANTLHLGSGPLVRLNHCPRLDEPMVITLSGITLRNAASLIECRYNHVEQSPGKISIHASRSVFAPRAESGLLVFTGQQRPDRILQAVQWTGQDCLLAPKRAFAVWQPGDEQPTALDDSAARVVGLVRSRIEFAGSAEDGPAASQVIHWQAPLRTTRPPGVDVLNLPGT